MSEYVHIEPATGTFNGREHKVIPVRVTDTMIGYEDHGLGTVVLMFEWPGSGQSTQARILSEFDKQSETQRGTAFGFDLILRIIDVFGVRQWEKIKGQRCYILKRESFGVIHGIANIDDPQKYLIFDDHHAGWFPSEAKP